MEYKSECSIIIVGWVASVAIMMMSRRHYQLTQIYRNSEGRTSPFQPRAPGGEDEGQLHYDCRNIGSSGSKHVGCTGTSEGDFVDNAGDESQ
jgi:hypothetical protein